MNTAETKTWASASTICVFVVALKMSALSIVVYGPYHFALRWNLILLRFMDLGGDLGFILGGTGVAWACSVFTLF